MPGRELLVGVLDVAKKIAVARVAVAEPGRELGQGLFLVAAAQEDLVGAQGPGGEDDLARANDPWGAGVRVLVVDRPAPARIGADVADRATGLDPRAEGLGLGEVGEVEGVLGAVAAAELTLGAQLAGLPALAGSVDLGPTDGLGRVEVGPIHGLGGRVEHLALGQLQLRRDDLHAELGGDLGVVGLEAVEVEGLGPARILEHDGRGAIVDAGVDQRAAAQARGRDRCDPGHEAELVQTLRGALVRVAPQQRVDVLDVTGEVLGFVALASLEHEHLASGLGEAERGDRATEARTDHDRVDHRLASRWSRMWG